MRRTRLTACGMASASDEHGIVIGWPGAAYRAVTEIVSDRRASADFIAVLEKLDAGYPAQAKIRVLLGARFGDE